MTQQFIFVLDERQKNMLRERCEEILNRRSVKEISIFYVELFGQEPTNLDLISFAMLLNACIEYGIDRVLDKQSIGFIRLERAQEGGGIYDSRNTSDL